MEPIEEENHYFAKGKESVSDSDPSSPMRENKRAKTCECNSDSYPYRIHGSPNESFSSQSDHIEGEGSSILPDDCFSVQRCRELLCRMIVKEGLRFSIVESEELQQLFCLAQSKFIMPSLKLVVRDSYRLYIKEKEELKKMLVKKGQGVSLTINTWKTIKDLDYMVLTAHFVDDNWKLQRKILNFCLTPINEVDILAEEIEKCLLEWGIERVFTVTVDDAIFKDGALAYLEEKIRKGNKVVLNGEFMHVRGCTHIVNLLVCDALKGFEDSITKIRNAIRRVMSSSSRLEAFKKCVKDEKISSYTDLICLDTPNRWDSTYIMLDNAEKFQKAFERLQVEDGEFCLDFFENDRKPPLGEDWDNARALVMLLKAFHGVTLKISSWSCVTSHCFLTEICSIQEQILRYSRSDNSLYNDIVRNMKVEYQKYCEDIENINYLLFVAIVLDPRYKLKCVVFILSFLYGEEKSKEIGKNVENITRRLYDEYQTSITEGETALTSTDQMLVKGEKRYGTYATLFAKFMIQQDIEENKTELDQYLSECFASDYENFDVLEWWKVRSPTYEILGKMAKDVFAIPLSTTPPELAFSTGVQVLDSYRSSLPPLWVEALICLQNWLSSPQNIDKYNPTDEFRKLEDEFSCLFEEFSGSESMKIELEKQQKWKFMAKKLVD